MKVIQNEGLTYDIVIDKNLSRYDESIHSIFDFLQEITKINNIFHNIKQIDFNRSQSKF